MSSPFSSRLLLPLTVVGFACSSGIADTSDVVSAHGLPNRTLVVAVGQELDLTLQTVGPGEYESPPDMSPALLRFLGVSQVNPSVPAGPTQLFRFKADAVGQVVIRFLHSGQNPVIEDTVVVR